MLDDDPMALLAEFTQRSWGDGLPIVAPTPERVAAMLGGRDGGRVLGSMPPLWRQVTLEKLAINAVMAGCEPAAFPIIVAAVEAMLDPTFNLYGVQATTHPVAPLLVVNGPYGRRIGLHGGSRLLRSRLPHQRHHRAGHPPHPAQRRWRLAGSLRHGHPGQPRQVRLLHRRERGGLAVGAAARGRRGHRVRW